MEAIMTARQEVAKRETTEVQAKPREQEIVLAPAVDVFENAHGITVEAEMPGVSKDRLNVQADRNSLLIEGDLVIDMPSGIEALYADVQATKYRRSFVLSGELENRSDRSEPQGRRAHGTHSQAGRVSAAQDRGPHSLTSSSPDVAVGTSGSQ